MKINPVTVELLHADERRGAQYMTKLKSLFAILRTGLIKTRTRINRGGDKKAKRKET